MPHDISGAAERLSSPAMLLLVICAWLPLVACSVSAERTVAPAISPASPSPGSSAAAACPSPGEGTCLGDLSSGTTYQSTSFRPQVTFSVPVEGWMNAEDYPGTFSLLAPDNTVSGINAQTSDYIGIATSIVPSGLKQARGCVFRPIPGNWSTPGRVASYFTSDSTLMTTRPRPASVGGLRGVVLDVRVKPGATLTSCTVAGQRFKFTGAFSGSPPTQLDHAVVRDETIRLYLLAHAGRVMLVEANDVDAVPAELISLTTVVRALRFSD